ncbi:MAG: molybdenum cofactor guanylyltransferase [Phycisphaerae bacterium]|jgi:molybdopterin-guanine dinucleotide biosynthesis protein A
MSEKSAVVKQGPDIACVAGILVGGGSTRMGRPKATLPMPHGRTMIEHVAGAVTRAGPWISEWVILGQGPELPAALAGVRVLRDGVCGAGPLAGLIRLLEYAGSRWGLLLACDLPLLEPGLLNRLGSAAGADCDAVAFRCSGRPDRWHACCALYHPRLLEPAVAELRDGGRSLNRLLAASRLRSLNAGPRQERQLMNLNTPDDYERLLDP